MKIRYILPRILPLPLLPRCVFTLLVALGFFLPLAARADKPSGKLAGKPETTALERRADALLQAMAEAVRRKDARAYLALHRADFRDDDGRDREAETRILANAWAAAPELRLRAERESVKERSRGYELVARTTLVTKEGARPERVRYLVDDEDLLVRATWLDDAEDRTDERIESRAVEKSWKR